MDDTNTRIEDDDIKCLELFITENDALEELETTANEFNIFTSLGIQHFEIRHSIFLSWILDPSETHGLGDYYLKIFLKRAIKEGENNDFNQISIIDIDFWSLDHVEVKREWRKIDIIIVDNKNKFICVIENKVWSKEHDNQLQRYYEISQIEYPNYLKMFLYLNVEGDAPDSDEEGNWIPISYGLVNESLEYMLRSKKTNLGDEVIIFINHYLEMLRRYIVKDSKIEKLCKQIYKAHQRAIDLIIEHKPDRLEDISQLIQSIIMTYDNFIPDVSTKNWIRFTTKNLDFIPKKGKGWHREINRILLFEILNLGGKIDIVLIIGPGEQSIREKIHKLALEKNSVFNVVKTELSLGFPRIYRKNLINKAKDYTNMSNDELKSLLKDKINEWEKKDLPKIEKELFELKGYL